MKSTTHFRLGSANSLIFIAITSLLPCVSLASDYTWDGGGGDASWLTGANWAGDPGTVTFGQNSIQTFNSAGATNLTNFIGGNAVIGSLNFNANADAAVSIRLADSLAGGAPADLAFDVSSGTAKINVDADAAGAFTLGVSDGNINLSDNLSINHNGTGILLIDRPITGTGTGITKTGSGPLTLAGANTFDGGFTFAGGTLTLDYATSDSSKLSDTAPFTLQGGTLNLTGGTHMELVASTTLAAGGTQLNRTAGTAVIALGAITRSPYATLNINADNIATTTTAAVNGILGGGITRFGRFAKLAGNNIVINSGETTLPTGATSATVNYTTGGAIVRTMDSTIYSLRYQAGGTVDLGGFSLTLDSGGLILVNNNPNQILNGTLKGSASGELIIHCVGSAAQVVDAKISDNGGPTALVKAGPAVLNLGNTANDYGGPTYINEGTLTTTASEVIPDTSVVTILNGGTLNVGTKTETVSTVVLNGGTITSSGAGTVISTGSAYDMRSGTVNGKLGGSLGLVKSTDGTLILGAVNTYFGGTTIDAGTIKATSASIFGTGNGTNVVINSGATLDLNGKGVLIAAFSGAGTVDNTSATGNTLQIGKNGAGGTFSGIIQNSGGGNLSLWKWGNGTTILSGANTYTGLTWAVGGILSVNTIGSIAAPAPSALGSPIDADSGAIRFSSGSASTGTLQYTGTGTTTDRPIDLRGSTAGGVLDASGSGPITFTGNVIATGAGSKSLVLQGTNTDNNTFAGQIVDNSAVNITSLVKDGTGTWVLNAVNPYTGSTTVKAGKLTLATAAAIDQTSGIDVNAGGTFDISGIAATTYNIGNVIPQTLGGGGTIDATNKSIVLGNSATLAPGDGPGTLQILLGSGTLNIAAAAGFEFELGTTSDKVDLPSGTLNIGNGVVGISDFTFSNAGGLTGGVYVLFQSNNLTGTLDAANLTGSVAGYSGTLSISGNNVILTVSGSPYSSWIDGYTAQIPNAADRLPEADADGDGVSNFVEFALKGDPANSTKSGLTAVLVQDTDTPPDTKELTLIAAVRRGATFSANAEGAQTATADGVQYVIEGSLDLASWNSAVSAIATGANTAPPASGLTEDLTGTDWEYRTFSLDASEGLPNKGFLRIKIVH